jgi:hypothetical protein
MYLLVADPDDVGGVAGDPDVTRLNCVANVPSSQVGILEQFTD